MNDTRRKTTRSGSARGGRPRKQSAETKMPPKREHTSSSDCWCEPEEIEEGVWVHHNKDLKEWLEKD